MALADTLLTGGRVHTVDPTLGIAEAVALADGKILAVGSVDELSELRGPATEVIDTSGKMVLPGFQDAHVHPPSAGLDRMRCNLEDVVDRDEVYRIIRTYAETHPDEPWILGGNWSLETFPGGIPTAAELDALVPDRPVFLPNRDGHDAWVNSKALEIAGITAETPDPEDGRIGRDATGAPVGVLHEGAQYLVTAIMPSPEPEAIEQGILLAQEFLHSLGITAWQDAIVGDDMWTRSIGPYAKLAADGRLTARVVGALWWDRDGGEGQLERFAEVRERFSSGRFQATSIKLMLDGVIENFTASMLEPYLSADGKPTDNTGISMLDVEALIQAAPAIDAAGFQMHFHAIGDRAVRDALDVIEAAAKANGEVDPRDLRHHISHIQVVHPDDIPRFAALQATANGQPEWACREPQMEALTIPFIGPERTGWQYPFGSLLRSGARLAFGSDWAVSTPDPLKEMEVAVRRQSWDIEGRPPLGPEEAITIDEAIHAFTMGSAYVNHLDAVTGSITPGKFADLCVVDEDLFGIPDARLSRANVVLTLVEGQQIYRDPSFS